MTGLGLWTVSKFKDNFYSRVKPAIKELLPTISSGTRMVHVQLKLG